MTKNKFTPITPSEGASPVSRRRPPLKTELTKVAPTVKGIKKVLRQFEPLQPIMELQVATEDERELARLTALDREHLRGLVQPPPGQSPAEAEAWAQARLASLSADAAVEMEYALRRGDAKVRLEAARGVLDRAGFAPTSEARSGGAAPVLILVGDDMKRLPWARKALERVDEDINLNTSTSVKGAK